MNEFLHLLRYIPRPARWLTLFFGLAGAAYIISRMLGLKGFNAWIPMLIVLFFCAIFAVLEVVRKGREKKKSREFEGSLGLNSRRSEVGKEEVREALADLSAKWQGSVAQLREAGMSIYSLPWYLLIGEPQSGKSTTLVNSGLEFPVGAEALSGSGGTRNCDWWFSNEAVILDTAGRFTFQEESAPDQQEWSAFLKLLRRHRKLCPINGAIVVIPATSLVEDSPEDQEKKAKNIRQKLLQLQKDLEIRFPIFILVTKADRVLGFTEFFSKLDPVDQRQLFGWSNPGTPEDAWDLKGFSDIFDDMVDRVHKLRLRLLKDEANLPMIDKLFVFPEEMRELKEPLANYFQTIFANTRFEEPFLFRGFYLTSGVQQGRPIARACRDLLRVQVGDPQAVLDDLEQVFHKSRAFFIRDFYEKKVFPEQGLIARTRAALKKDRTYRRVMYGLSATLGIASFLILLLGGLNLWKVVSPVKKTATAARDCLDPKRSQPCELGSAYTLIKDLETNKQQVREAKWTMRTFLRSSTRNEITQELIPAIQAEMFQRKVLAPLLATADIRSQGLDWTGHAKDYETFYDAFGQLLRFRRMAGTTAGEDLTDIQQGLRIAPLLAFCKATPGRDPQGQPLDDWLRADVNLDQADKIFQDAMRTKPDLTRLAVPKGDNAHAAFRDYWTIRNLARWDAQTDDYLRTYKELYEEMVGLAPSAAAAVPAATAVTTNAPSMVTPPPGAAPAATPPPGVPAAVPVSGALVHFADLAQRFAKNYADGEAHMKTERQAAGDKRPGPVASWKANCELDYNALTHILPTLARPDEVAALCTPIPADWNKLNENRQQYAYLFQTRAEGPKQVMGWSPDAARLKEPLVALGALAAPQQVATDAQAFQATVDAQQGSLARIGAISNTYTALQQKVFAPVTALVALTGAAAPAPLPTAAAGAYAAPPPPAAPPVAPLHPSFRLAEGIPGAKTVAALALAGRVLPPAAQFFTSNEAFGLGCNECFYLKYAEDHVPPANDFLRWARLTLAPAVNQPEVREPIDRIQTAEIDYLSEFINREKGGGGGGSGGGGGGGGGATQSFVTPARAGQAPAWRDFVREIRRWEPVLERAGGGGGGGGGSPSYSSGGSAGGLTVEAMTRFVEGNDSLRELLNRLREREGRREASAAAAARAAANRPVARLSPDLVSTAETYKRCIAGLEDDALKAWRQLALGKDGASLADFHAFSANLRLRGNPSAAQMARIETYAASLLVQEIRPAFESRLRNLWTVAGSCCNDRFPFISQARLQGLQESYRRGPSAGGPWTPPGRDTGSRTVTDGLQLDTVTLSALDSLFFAGGSLDGLFDDFVIDPIVEGREKSIDFVGGNKERLRVLRQWQRFVYGEGRTSAAQTVKVKLVSTASTAPRIFVGERMGQLDLFGPNPVRPSTDAARARIINMPMIIDDRLATVVGRNEDKAGGWSGVLSLRGGPLKIPYFVQLASDGRPREGGRVWTVRIQLPDYVQPQQRLEGIFELTFERPLPEIVPGAQLNGF